MLKAMRKHAKYFYVLFVLIILTFIFWGVGRVDNSQKLPVAQIGPNEKITAEEYWRAYERLLDVYKEIYKEKLDPDKMHLKQQVLDALIEERVLQLAAGEAGITVTDGELQEAIASNPAFMRNGVFNKQIYLRSLQLNRLTPGEYEAARRRELMVEKMKRLVTASVDLSPAELKKAGEDEALRKLLLDAKKQAALRSYIAGLKARIEIKVNPELLS